MPALALERIEECIYTVRGQRVMLDADLAAAYGVATKVLNQAVKRNRDKFPTDFAFQLTGDEATALRSQIVTSKGRGGRRYVPYAFTEHGAIMAATVLNSPQAVQMSVFVMRAFIKMRAALSDNRELARKLAALEKELKDRLDVHEAAIVTILQRVMDIIDPPALPEPPKKKIGFQVKEGKARYMVRRKQNDVVENRKAGWRNER
ncbi:MAG: ORF6N domain-containing protein [Verrucomicrobia bacterium]|nr:ORF6N domain-containing protein [Verrucomicrobiota bacterium]